MKKLFVVLFVVSFWQWGYAQVRFFEGTWSEVLQQAQKQNKPIFVDFYTSWCGPCKLMTKTTFANTNVGDYLNNNFIAYKVDCEKGEGIQLAEKFEIYSYPSLCFFDKNGKLQSKEIGYKNAEEFLSLAQKYRKKLAE
jgi:thiol:disulfide interchange protein